MKKLFFLLVSPFKRKKGDQTIQNPAPAPEEVFSDRKPGGISDAEAPEYLYNLAKEIGAQVKGIVYKGTGKSKQGPVLVFGLNLKQKKQNFEEGTVFFFQEILGKSGPEYLYVEKSTGNQVKAGFADKQQGYLFLKTDRLQSIALMKANQAFIEKSKTESGAILFNMDPLAGTSLEAS